MPSTIWFVCCGGALLFWPIFQALHRRWSLLAKRLFFIFVVTATFVLAVGSTLLGPWGTRDNIGATLFLLAGNAASLCASIAVSTAGRSQTLPRWLWSTGLLTGTIFLLFAGWMRFLIDWRNQPVCHKGIMLTLESWRQDHHTDAYPNTAGSSSRSLAYLDQFYPPGYLTNAYAYVPGLSDGDPPDLVLLYMKHPTRWVWHGGPRTFFAPRGWLVVPVGFDPPWTSNHLALGECSETLSAPAFRQRLLRTLDFVRTNQRPNWEAVVVEHSKVLRALPDPELANLHQQHP